MRFVFWKTLVGLFAYDALFFGRKFARLHRLVKSWPINLRSVSPDCIERVCDEVNLALIWYPKRVLCLQRAAVTTCLLRDCGVPAQMVLGAQKLPFKAHAWVEVNGKAINERANVQAMFGVWERC
jgi:hypothetical protein